MKGEILSWSLMGVKGLSCQHMSIFSALCDLKQELIGLPFSIQLTLPLRWQGLRRVRMTRKWAPVQLLAWSRRALSGKLKKQPTGRTLTPLVRWAQIRGQDQAPWARWILLISCWRAEESLKGFVENFCGESLGISLPTGLSELDQFIQRTLFSVHMKNLILVTELWLEPEFCSVKNFQLRDRVEQSAILPLSVVPRDRIELFIRSWLSIAQQSS